MKGIKKTRRGMPALVIVLVLAFALVLAGCLGMDDDGFSGDTALNGTWVRNSGTSILTLDNGNMEYFDYAPFYRGTYTTNNGMVTEKLSQIYSGNAEVSQLFREMGLQTNKWYSMPEIKSLTGSYFTYIAYDFGINPVTFEFDPYQYFISGNTLYWGEAVYTRQR